MQGLPFEFGSRSVVPERTKIPMPTVSNYFHELSDAHGECYLSLIADYLAPVGDRHNEF